MNKQSDLLIAGELACNNEERLERWKEKKIRLALVQRNHHHSDASSKDTVAKEPLNFNPHHRVCE